MYPAIHVFGLEIGTYGICMMVGLILAYLIFQNKIGKRGVRFESGIVIVAVAFGLALLGAYLLYLLASVGIGTIVQMIREGRILELFQGGGLVFYGGLIGGIFGAWLGCHLVGVRFIAVINDCAPALAVAHAIGRVGCYLAGCCYGCPSDLPFCLPLSPAIAGGAPLFPVQLAEALCDLIMCVILLVYLKKRRPAGRAAGIFLMSYAVYRSVWEFFRFDAVRGFVGALSTSQLISIFIFLAGAVFCFVLPKLNISDKVNFNDFGMKPGFGKPKEEAAEEVSGA